MPLIPPHAAAYWTHPGVDLCWPLCPHLSRSVALVRKALGSNPSHVKAKNYIDLDRIQCYLISLPFPLSLTSFSDYFFYTVPPPFRGLSSTRGPSY